MREKHGRLDIDIPPFLVTGYTVLGFLCSVLFVCQNPILNTAQCQNSKLCIKCRRTIEFKYEIA